MGHAGEALSGLGLFKFRQRLHDFRVRCFLGTVMLCGSNGMGSANHEATHRNSDIHHPAGAVGRNECHGTPMSLVRFRWTEERHPVNAEGRLWTFKSNASALDRYGRMLRLLGPP